CAALYPNSPLGTTCGGSTMRRHGPRWNGRHRGPTFAATHGYLPPRGHRVRLRLAAPRAPRARIPLLLSPRNERLPRPLEGSNVAARHDGREDGHHLRGDGHRRLPADARPRRDADLGDPRLHPPRPAASVRRGGPAGARAPRSLHHLRDLAGRPDPRPPLALLRRRRPSARGAALEARGADPPARDRVADPI